jgi:transposase InsO family protein
MTKPKSIQQIEAKMKDFEESFQRNQATLQQQQNENFAAMQETMRQNQEQSTQQLQQNFQLQMQVQMENMQRMMQEMLAAKTVTTSSSPNASTSQLTESVIPDGDPYLEDTEASGTFRPHGMAKYFDYYRVEPIPSNADFRDYRQWREKWESNAISKTISQFTRKQQVSAVIDAMGPSAAKIVRRYMAVDLKDPELTVDEILEALHKYYRSQRSITLDRVKFEKRKQGEHESFANFRCDLEDLAEDGELCIYCREQRIVARIIIGTKHPEVKEKLLGLPGFPTLEKTVKVCHAHEVGMKSRITLETEEEQPTTVNKVSSYKKSKSKEREQSQDKNTKGEKCGRCGGKSHKKENCPAKDKSCNKCDKKGHFAPMCKGANHRSRSKSRERKEVSAVISGNKPAVHMNSNIFCKLDTISVDIIDSDGKSKCRIKSVLPDTGGSVSLMSVQDYKKTGEKLDNLRRKNDVVYAVNNLTINILGRTEFLVRYGQIDLKVTFLVSDEYKETLLSLDTCKKLGIVPRDFPNQNLNYISNVKVTDMKEQLLKEFQDVFDIKGKLKPMKGKPIHIELTPDAKAFRVNGPRPIPIPLRENAKKLIFDLVEQGILEEVTEPTDWLHPFTVVVKPDGSLRLCVDLRMLNKFVKRPNHPVRTPRDAVAAIPPDSKYFTTCDAKSGYFQVELDEESQVLTTFATPWGRFKHLRATMGLSCAGDEFNRRTDTALAGLPNFEKVVDDILIHGQTYEEHIENVKAFLLRCREAGITLNPKKFNLAQNKVKFAGHIVSEKGIEADPEKLKAIKCFPKPNNITDLRSFLGLVEQLAGFTNEVAEAMQPLRPLLSRKAEFYWTSDHDKAFQATKNALLNPPVLATYDPCRPTMLQTDASRTKGLGYILLQQDKQNQWKLIDANSRFISDTEARYAMVELELLGVKWAMKKCHNYLFGLKHFDLIVDHQPLVSILDKQTLDCIDNARIQRLKAATGAYNFTTTWKKGKDHKMADALSRAPVSDPSDEDLEEDKELYNYVSAVRRTNAIHIDQDTESMLEDSFADPTLNEIRDKGQKDEEYRALIEHLESDCDRMSAKVSHFKSVMNEMSTDQGLVLFRQRLLIPRAMRKDVLKRLHASHQGIERTMRRARQTVYWPGIYSDIRSTVEACQSCQMYKSSQRQEPLERDLPPKRIFEHVAADYFEYEGKQYLAMTDRYSGWLDIFYMKDANSNTLIRKLTDYFVDKGCPVKFFTDGGRQFTAELTQSFFKDWGVSHRLSSPTYPQSNGLAESAVKTLKSLLKKCRGKIDSTEFCEGLLELRNSPKAGGKSPAEIVYGQPMRSKVPSHHSAFEKKWLIPLDEHDSKTAELAKKAMDHYDKNTKSLPPLEVGSKVLVQDHQTKLWDRTGNVVTVGPHRKYWIKLPSGRCLWRNRKFLRPLKEDAGPERTEQIVQEPKQDAPRRGTRVRFSPDRLTYG